MRSGYAESVWATHESSDASSEQEVLVAYAPLVKRVVQQLVSQAAGALDRDDMLQIGLVGLLDALRRYGSPDAKFGSYASMRIRGAILDELRRQDWRPRTVRQESHRLRDRVRELRRSLGQEPTRAQIIEALGITEEIYQRYQLAENAEQLASFDEIVRGAGQPAMDAPQSLESQFILRRTIEQGLLALNERERRVVQLYYEFDLSLAEIAAVLDLTEARVCQINKAALQKMRERMQ
jgi:RNA polymerase sigma factor FliA